MMIRRLFNGSIGGLRRKYAFVRKTKCIFCNAVDPWCTWYHFGGGTISAQFSGERTSLPSRALWLTR